MDSGDGEIGLTLYSHRDTAPTRHAAPPRLLHQPVMDYRRFRRVPLRETQYQPRQPVRHVGASAHFVIKDEDGAILTVRPGNNREIASSTKKSPGQGISIIRLFSIADK